MVNDKKCSKCKDIKSLDLFCNNKAAKDGKQTYCKECRKVYQKEYGQTEKCRIAQKEYQRSELGKAAQKRQRQSEKGKEAAKRNRQSDKYKEWNYKQSAEYTQYYIRQLIRSHIYRGLRKISTGTTQSCEKYGISIPAIYDHLYPHPNTLGVPGKYHIHHIYPLSRFDLNNPEHIKVAFDPLNHQWLLAEDNLKKGNKIPKQSDIPKALSKKLDRIRLEIRDMSILV